MKRIKADLSGRGLAKMPNFKKDGLELDEVCGRIPNRLDERNAYKLWKSEHEVDHKYSISGCFLLNDAGPLVLRAFGGEIDKQVLKDSYGVDIGWLSEPRGAECELSFEGTEGRKRHRVITGRFSSFLDQSIPSQEPHVLTDRGGIAKALGRIVEYYREALAERICQSRGSSTESIARRAYYIRKMIHVLELDEVIEPPTAAIVYPERFSRIPTLSLSLEIFGLSSSMRRDFKHGYMFVAHPLNPSTTFMRPGIDTMTSAGFFLGSHGLLTNDSGKVDIRI